MKTGSLVIYGWTYKRKKILSDSQNTGIIISTDPEIKWIEVDKLQYRKGEWEIVSREEDDWVVSVLWPNGIVTQAATTNLVEV